jgi:single-strand DNA-binding protein
MSLNVVNLIGRAGRDPEIKYFESGKVLCTLTLAVNRRSKDDEPDWFNLKFWDKTAEIVKNYVRKGSQIGITGSLNIESWSDKTTGSKRFSPVINVDRLELLGSKKDSELGFADSALS